MRIKAIKARQVINSKGAPTIEVEASTERYTAYSSIPLAASKSKYEYYDVFDHDLQKFDGKTLDIVIENINRIVAPELIGQRSMDQEDIDNLILEIDSSYDRSRLGVNAITAISQSITKLGALESDLPLFKYIRVLHDFSEHNNERLLSSYMLPKPVLTIFRSSSHDRNSDLPLQEVMVLPRNKFSYLSNLIDLYDAVKQIDTDHKSHSLKSYVGFIDKQLLKLPYKFDLGLDVSGSRFISNDNNGYVMNNLHNRKSTFIGNAKKLIDIYLSLVNDHNLVFLEDLFEEDEYSGWYDILDKGLKVNKKLQIVSDDFTATNIERLEKISLLEASNNVVIKPSQAGTISEVLHFAARARKLRMNITVSYRFGETEDTFIADLATGINADFIRIGYFLGSEHISKLNRLAQIEHSL